MANKERLIPGLALVLAISGTAYGLAQGVGLVRYGASSLTLAIVVGALLGNLLPGLGRGACRPGLAVAQKRFLRTGVALYGFNLSLQQIIQVGSSGLLADLLLVSSTLGAGWFIGTRLLGLDRETVLLTSAGSAICGAAAVVATVPVLRLDEEQMAEKSAVAVATVVLFGTLAMFLYPLLYAWIGAGRLDFGIYV
ncbi:MAG TPA: putative sulfate exporter family transporter, partial [Azospira sp.]|nr:putative sulfate exporter family transporter [Azospira sp.]